MVREKSLRSWFTNYNNYHRWQELISLWCANVTMFHTKDNTTHQTNKNVWYNLIFSTTIRRPCFHFYFMKARNGVIIDDATFVILLLCELPSCNDCLVHSLAGLSPPSASQPSVSLQDSPLLKSDTPFVLCFVSRNFWGRCSVQQQREEFLSKCIWSQRPVFPHCQRLLETLWARKI